MPCARMLASLLLSLVVAQTPQHTTRITVSSDAWHSAIAFPLAHGFEEWGFANKSWYVDGKQGMLNAPRTLLLPNLGVVEVSLETEVLAVRSGQRPAHAWTFDLSDTQLANLRAFLVGSITSDVPYRVDDNRTWYLARRSYHLFHTCHHWVMAALAAAGFSTSDIPALTPAGTWLELEILARAAM